MYNSSTGKIALNEPLNTTDVRLALSAATNDVGKLCTHSGINLWAKYKPFPYAKPGFATEAARLAASREQDYGLTIPVFTKDSIHDEFMDGEWTITPLAATDGKRIGDFRGYRRSHDWTIETRDNGLSGVFGVYVGYPAKTVGQGESIYASIDWIDPDGGTTGAQDILYPADFTRAARNIAGCWFGILLRHRTNSTYDRVFIEEDESAGPRDLTAVITSAVPNGDYYVVPILVQSATAFGAWKELSTLSGDIYTVNGAHSQLTKQTNPATYKFDITATKQVTSSGVVITVTMRNTTSAAVTVNQLFAYIMAEGAFDGPYYDELIGKINEYTENSHTVYSNGITADGNILVRYQAGTPTTVASGATVTQTITCPYTQDGAGNPYNLWTSVWIGYRYNNVNYVLYDGIA